MEKKVRVNSNIEARIMFDRFLKGGRFNTATQKVEKPYEDYEDEYEVEEDE